MTFLSKINAALKSDKKTEVLYKITDEMKKLESLAYRLSKLYGDNPWLNDIQPNEFQKVIPMSLDEWHVEIIQCGEEWADILAGYELGKVKIDD